MARVYFILILLCLSGSIQSQDFLITHTGDTLHIDSLLSEKHIFSIPNQAPYPGSILSAKTGKYTFEDFSFLQVDSENLTIDTIQLQGFLKVLVEGRISLLMYNWKEQPYYFVWKDKKIEHIWFHPTHLFPQSERYYPLMPEINNGYYYQYRSLLRGLMSDWQGSGAKINLLPFSESRIALLLHTYNLQAEQPSTNYLLTQYRKWGIFGSVYTFRVNHSDAGGNSSIWRTPLSLGIEIKDNPFKRKGLRLGTGADVTYLHYNTQSTRSLGLNYRYFYRTYVRSGFLRIPLFAEFQLGENVWFRTEALSWIQLWNKGRQHIRYQQQSISSEIEKTLPYEELVRIGWGAGLILDKGQEDGIKWEAGYKSISGLRSNAFTTSVFHQLYVKMLLQKSY